MNPVAPVLLAALACGQAIGQSIDALPEPRLRLYVEARPGLRLGGPLPRAELAARIGVELKLAPGYLPGIAKGTLLRATLGESTHLSLRVYRGGLGVMLSSQF